MMVEPPSISEEANKMSKGTCGLFSKTNGAIKTEGIDPAVQKTKALNYASEIHQNGTKAEKK